MFTESVWKECPLKNQTKHPSAPFYADFLLLTPNAAQSATPGQFDAAAEMTHRQAEYGFCISNNTSGDPCRASSIARWLVKLFRIVNSNLYGKINWSHLCQLRKWVIYCLERKNNAANWTDGERNLISMEMTNEKVGRVQARTIADCLCRWRLLVLCFVFFFLSHRWLRAWRGVAAVKHVSRSSSRFIFMLVLYYNWPINLCYFPQSVIGWRSTPLIFPASFLSGRVWVWCTVFRSLVS